MLTCRGFALVIEALPELATIRGTVAPLAVDVVEIQCLVTPGLGLGCPSRPVGEGRLSQHLLWAGIR